MPGKIARRWTNFESLSGRTPLLPARIYSRVYRSSIWGSRSLRCPYLKKAAEVDPARPAPLLALGKVYVALRDYGRANEVYTKATSLDSDLADAWYGVGVTDRSLADELLNQAARSGRMDDGAIKQRVHHLLDGALEALNRAVQLDPNSARTHLLMAESLSDAGKLADAVREYQTALRLDPNLDAAYLGLATGYWKEREFEQALPFIETRAGQVSQRCRGGRHDSRYTPAQRRHSRR